MYPHLWGAAISVRRRLKRSCPTHIHSRNTLSSYILPTRVHKLIHIHIYIRIYIYTLKGAHDAINHDDNQN